MTHGSTAFSGSQLRALRRALNLKQRTFGHLLGVREREVRRWEHGESQMGWAARRHLAQLLEVAEVQRALDRAGVTRLATPDA